MSQIALTPGNYIVPFIGTQAVTLASQSWFTAQNVNVYRPSANRAGYVKNAGGSNQQFAPFTQLVPSAPGGIPEAYIFEVKAAFSIDSTLFGAPVPDPTQLILTFPNGQTNYAFPAIAIQAAQAGTYALPGTGTGLSSLTYTKNGQAVATTVALAANDVLIVTGTTASNAAGVLTLVKQ